MKRRILKLVRNVTISIISLLILFVGGGLAYTWYAGQQDPGVVSQAIAEPVEPAPRAEITPTKLATNAKVSASVQMLTSPVAPGSNASITVKTNPKSKCTIVVEYNKVASKDSGLVTRVADEFGIVSWTWTVESTVPVGKWPVKVTCAYNKQSAVVQGDLKVAN